MLCGLKTILTDMNILNSYRHIRPKKVKYPIPEIPDDSGKKSGTDWVLPKIIGSGRVSGTRQALLDRASRKLSNAKRLLKYSWRLLFCFISDTQVQLFSQADVASRHPRLAQYYISSRPPRWAPSCLDPLGPQPSGTALQGSEGRI